MPYKHYGLKKKYTILYLLNRQLKTFKKMPDFQTITALYNASTLLKSLKFSRKCYSSLNKAGISPEHLSSFYGKFGLPRHPFFPMFFKLKKEFTEQKKYAKDKKDEYIFKKMNDIPHDVKIFLRYLAKFEMSLNKRKRYPVWKKNIYPGTKKQVDKIIKFTRCQWADLFLKYTDKLESHYPATDKLYGKKIVALFIMELPIRKHSPEEIKKQYRLLSKKHHPDVGGDAGHFNMLQSARDALS